MTVSQEMQIEGLKIALRRAAGVIQGCHAALAGGINGEAIIALATADQRDGEKWQDAVARAERELRAKRPSAAVTAPSSTATAANPR